MVEPPDIFELVLVRRRSWWEAAAGFLRTARIDVIESEADGEKRYLLG